MSFRGFEHYAEQSKKAGRFGFYRWFFDVLLVAYIHVPKVEPHFWPRQNTIGNLVLYCNGLNARHTFNGIKFC